MIGVTGASYDNDKGGRNVGDPSGKTATGARRVAKVDPDLCVACGSCVEMCAQDAISLVTVNHAARVRKLVIQAQFAMLDHNLPLVASKLNQIGELL